MNKKMLCAIFMASLILSLHFLSDIIVYARENSGFKEEKAKLLPLSESETASEHICEPEADAQQEICETANAPVTEYDKNFKLEILDRDTCTKITLEDYLIMVVMSEMPYTFESEALRAQAVAARTYTLKQLEDGTRHEKNTVCSDPAHCSAGLNKHEYIEKYGTEAYEKAYTAVY
ncbi:MAG: hypothetical protein IJ391_04095, partial [Clostridia bacterium]|nr:hypothetical protein [Clostridia bacterium]